MKYVAFGKICKLQNGKPFKSSEWSETGLPIVRIQNLTDESKSFNYCDLEIDSRFHIKNGDLLFSWSGTPGSSFGAFFWERGRALLNQHIFRVDVEAKNVDKRYLCLAINSRLNEIIDQAHGGVGLKHITKRKLETIHVPIPPVNDQIRIATLLSKVESLIAKRKKSIADLDELLKSTFLEMFGDPVRNEMGWDRPELKQFGKIITGNTPSRKTPENYSSNYIEWIKTDNILSDQVYVSKSSENLSERGAKKARIIEPGALLVACIAGSLESIGRSALTDRKIAFNQQINAIQPKKDVNKGC